MKPTWITKQGAHSLPYDPTPSHEDIEVTKRLAECGKVLGVELLDHVIIGDQRYLSLKEKGYMMSTT